MSKEFEIASIAATIMAPVYRLLCEKETEGVSRTISDDEIDMAITALVTSSTMLARELLKEARVEPKP